MQLHKMLTLLPQNKFSLLMLTLGMCLVVGFSCKQFSDATKDVSKNLPVDSNTKSTLNQAAETTEKLAKAFNDFRKAFEEMPIEAERDLGESVAVQAYATPGFGVPVKRPQVMEYLNCMANVIGQNSDRPMIPYHVAVVKSNEINAFSAPGGYIFVTSGLINMLANEAELAMVIGHEIAHIAKRHAVKTLQRGQAWQGFIKLIAAGASMTRNTFDTNFDMFEGLVKDLAELKLHNYALADEVESDKEGLKYVVAVGYHPQAIITLLEKLKVHDSEAGSTHPTAEQRIQEIRADVEKYVAEKQGFVMDTERFAAMKAEIQSFQESEWESK